MSWSQPQEHKYGKWLRSLVISSYYGATIYIPSSLLHLTPTPAISLKLNSANFIDVLATHLPINYADFSSALDTMLINTQLSISTSSASNVRNTDDPLAALSSSYAMTQSISTIQFMLTYYILMGTRFFI